MRLHALDTADPARPASSAAAPADAAAILALTRTLAQQHGYAERVQRWHRHAGWLLGGLGLLAVLAGFSAGMTLVGSASRSVNVLWALLGLIGVHSVALLFWLLLGQAGGGAAGRLWFAVLQRWGLGASALPGKPDPLGRALVALLARDGLGRWWFGMITHALWLLALAAALLALLAVLSLRSVSFTLETTILPAAVFAAVVEGLGAAQFALPGAIDRVRAAVPDRSEGAAPSSTLVLAATDPANPYGAALAWPVRPDDAGGHRPGRKAGALVVLVDGALALYVERGGRTLLSWGDDPAVLAAAAGELARAVKTGVLGRLTVHTADGASVLAPDSTLGRALEQAGFVATPQGLRLRP